MIYFPENLIALDHFGATGFMVFQRDKFTVPEFLKPVGDLIGHDMGMDVNFHFTVECGLLPKVSEKGKSTKKRIFQIPMRKRSTKTTAI
jgi:hypothetical protein